MGGDFNTAMTEVSDQREALEEIGLLHLNSTRKLDHVRIYKWGSNQLENLCISESLLFEIKGFGFLPFDYGLESDHKCFYVDIRLKNDTESKKKSQRTLSSKNEQNAKKFWEYVLSHFEKQNIVFRLQTLRRANGVLTNNQFETKIQQIDREVTKILLDGERKISMQKSDYFIPKIPRLRKLRSYWRTILRRHRLHLTHEGLQN